MEFIGAMQDVAMLLPSFVPSSFSMADTFYPKIVRKYSSVFFHVHVFEDTIFVWFFHQIFVYIKKCCHTECMTNIHYR